MSNQWTINHAGTSPSAGDLIGCKIQRNQNGTTYEFTSQDNDVLSVTPGTELPSLPFDFPEFYYPAGQSTYKWNIRVETFTGGRQGNKAQGKWSNSKPQLPTEETGTWTAQAGAGMDEEGKEDAATARA